MSFWGFVGIALVLAIVLRVLRSIFQWVDYVAYGLIFILPIVVGIANGFWAGVGTFVATCIIVPLLFGLSDGTQVRDNGCNYVLKCSKCGYDELEVTEKGDGYVVTKCKRCGNVMGNKLF